MFRVFAVYVCVCMCGMFGVCVCHVVSGNEII